MRPSLRWTPAVLLFCLLAAACREDTGQNANRHNPPPAAPGAPDQSGNAEARGAPYKVPPYGRRGFPIETAKGDLTELFTTACGGTLCVTFSVEERIAGFGNCMFYETDPAAGVPFRREQIIVIVVGKDPCEPESPGPPTEAPSTEIAPPTVIPS